MKRMIFKLFLLALAIFLIPFVLLLTVCPQYTHSYNASFIDKMKRLESIDEPKIVLASNSNLAFGIDSEMIEQKFGIPVVNLGLHGGLGNAFHERMALFNLRKGDIVVISHLDYSDDDEISDPELALVTVENYFHYWKVFRMKDLPRVLGALPKYAFKCMERKRKHMDVDLSKESSYARENFNKYGDNVYPREIEAGESAPDLLHPRVNDICVNRINKLYEKCKKKGANLVVSSMPIICGLPGFDASEYESFQSELKKKLKCPFISDVNDYFIDKKYYYTSNLHLTNEGARIRTKALIKDLEKYFNSQPQS